MLKYFVLTAQSIFNKLLIMGNTSVTYSPRNHFLDKFVDCIFGRSIIK